MRVGSAEALSSVYRNGRDVNGEEKDLRVRDLDLDSSDIWVVVSDLTV